MTTKIPIDTFLNMKRYYTENNKIEIPNIVIINPINLKRKEKELTTTNNSWLSNIAHTYCEDKILISILNKLNIANYDKLLNDIRKENFSQIKLIELIFNKAIREPNYISLYTNLCIDLHLTDLINEKCLEQFYSKRHLNLMKFMFSLYEKQHLPNINKYIDILLTDINDINIEIFIYAEKEYCNEKNKQNKNKNQEYIKNLLLNLHQPINTSKLNFKNKFLFTDVLKKYGLL